MTLANRSSEPVELTGYVLGDAERPGKQEGLYALPVGVWLGAGERFVVARNAQAFRARWARWPDATFSPVDRSVPADESVPVLAHRRDLATGSWALNDSGDEVVLLTPGLQLADVVVFAGGDYGAVGIEGRLQASGLESLQRVPGAWFPFTPDQRHRFLAAPPDPFASRGLPVGADSGSVELQGGYWAAWGSLGAASNFSPDGIAPPHYLLAAAEADGLSFLAVADEEPAPGRLVIAGQSRQVVTLPAWQWQGENGEQAIVYSLEKVAATQWDALMKGVMAQGGLVQVRGRHVPGQHVPSRYASGLAAFTAIDAGGITAPGGIQALYRLWAEYGDALLPAGNASPHIPGIAAASARFTGLAVRHFDTEGVLEAMRERRGWLASRPGIWLTLHAEEDVWMGSRLAPANTVTLHIHYGDRLGAPAGLALWQNDRILHQLDVPPADGRWTVEVAAAPGTFYYVVATQLNGDFAVTAPLVVAQAGAAALVLNEVLPDPGRDYNGDGEVNSDDEFIELWNPNPYPVSLAGWQLSDERGDESVGHRFTFGPGWTIGGGQYLALWRTETRVNLNNAGDWVRLLDATGVEIDWIAWHGPVGREGAIARVPDGGAWVFGVEPTPGRANVGPLQQPGSHSPPPASGRQPTAVAELPPTHGQATGPPGSLATAKLQGLYERVEFRGQVTAPPGYFNSAIYVAEPARLADGTELEIAGLGIQVYLATGGVFAPLAEGDWVLVQGQLRSHRGEMEVRIDLPQQVWRIGPGVPLRPLETTPAAIGESLEGRLVTIRGVVDGWQGDSIYLRDADDVEAAPVRVTVRGSLGWKRPFVQRGEVYEATGIISQFAQRAPWNGGYRLLVRYESDLVKLHDE